MYVCLYVCKRDFLNRCMPIIFLDGCHLKGAMRGQILSAIKRDRNVDIFSITWAIIKAKNKES